MKKRIVLFLAVIMPLLLVACSDGSDGKADQLNKVPSDFTETVETEGNTTPKDKVLSWEALQSAVTVIDLTIDNWEDYFEIKEIEEITPADFEDEEPEIERDLYVQLKAENLCAIDAVMRFSFSEAMTHNRYDASTKELTSSSPGSYSDEEDTLDAEYLSNFGSIGTLGNAGTYTYKKYEHQGVIYESILDVKDIKCLKVSGKILVLNIPEDAWHTTRFGEKMPYILCQKDGEEQVIMKDGIARALKDLFFAEN